MNVRPTDRQFLVAAGVVVFITAIICYAALQFYILKTKHESAQKELAHTAYVLDRVSERLGNMRTMNKTLREELVREKARVGELAQNVEAISGTVGTLEKLSTLDEELLQKYSRVYFLNEHYRPSHLAQIPSQYWQPAHDDEFIHAKVLPYLLSMLARAEAEGIKLKVISAFRSFDEQLKLKSQYDVIYGEGTANQFSAAQGYSEHQLGTTVDFTTNNLGNDFGGLDETKAYNWLKKNAHKFGFILSYPEDNDYYQFEPWHWRFVGVKLATDLYERGMHFYDMPQREIDEYLIHIFD